MKASSKIRTVLFLTLLFLVQMQIYAGTRISFTSATVVGIPATLCSGNSLLLTLNEVTCQTNGPGGGTYTANYQWQDSPNDADWTNISGATSNTYNASPLSNTYYRCVITITSDPAGCGFGLGVYTTASGLITIASIPSQPGAISGSTSVTPSETGLIYSITAISGATGYTWTLPTGAWSITGGSGTNSITVTAGTAGEDGDITVTADNSCGSSTAQTLAVTVESFPTITLDATSVTVCQGITSGDLTYSATSGSPDQYSIDYAAAAQAEGFVDITDGTLPSSPISLTIPSGATSATYNANLTVKNSGTSLSSINYPITITVNPPTPATPGAITGDASVSPGATGLIYSISSVTNATSYTWTIPTGWTITAGDNTTSITVTSGGIGQDGDITVTADNSCGSSAATTLAVTVAANPPTITLDATNITVCQGTTTGDLSYSATTNSPDQYSINYNGTAEAEGFVDVVDAALPVSPIALTIPGGANPATYDATLTVKNSGTGLSSGIYPITITINAIPATPTISAGGATTFCSPGSVTLTSSASTGTYLWSTTETTQSIIVSTSGSYTLTITENGCSSPSSLPEVVTVNSTPNTPGAITGSSNTTPNTSGYVYSIDAVADATTYNWTVPTNWVIDSGDGTISISVTSGNNGDNGNIEVTAENTCGTSTASTKAVTSSAASNPPTITLGSNPEVCQGTTSANLTYSATSESPDQYSINYDVTAEGEGFVDIVDNALPASPIGLVVPIAAAGATYNGILTVKNSGSGLSSGDYSISVTVNTVITASIQGTSTVGPNTAGYAYYVTAVPGATNYTWSVPSGWTINSGNGTENISVTTGNIGDDGNVSLIVTNSCGDGSSTNFAVTVADPTVADHALTTCSSCHTFHNATGSTLTNASANEGLCLSCHVTGQMAETMPFLSSDKAIPGTSGNSHSWDALAANPTYETVIPTDAAMAARLTTDNKIVCSTCHDQHNSAVVSPYLRIDNTDDAMCKDCHSPRDVGLYTDATPGYGSHPIGNTVVYDDADSRFNASPTALLAVSNNDKIQCSSCHGVHDVTNSGTLTTDGNLLKSTNDNTLCLDCHAYTGHQGETCITCHQVHNTNKNNIYMIRDLITTPSSGDKTVVFTAETGTNSFADGDGTYDGICEVCHTTNASTYHYNTAAGDHSHEAGTNCTDCHTHDTDFAAPACSDCHIANFPGWGTTDGHFAHTSKYSYACNTCHFERGSGTDYHLFTDPLDVTDGVAEVNINPNGLATRGGLDANSPTYTAGTKTCTNMYCHSNGRSAYRGTDGTYTWSSTTGSQTATYAPIPTWDSSTDVSCALGDPLTGFACHEGPPGVEAVPNYLIDATNHGSMIDANDYFPKTGSHAPNRGAHYSNSQNLIDNGWVQVQCFYCHETDDVLTPAPNKKYQGTYGTSLHVDGQTHFDPRWHSNGGTIVNTMTYSYEGSAGHCGAGKTCW